MLHRILLALPVLVMCGVAAAAEPAAQAKAGDAGKMICRTIQESGSRLTRGRACHTKQEWEDLRRQMKRNIEHIQNTRPANMGG